MAPYGVEVCAGSAVLSSTLISYGLRMYAVDYEDNKFDPHVPILLRDLRNEADLRDVMTKCASAAYVHIAPPCGTFSRAREIVPGPPPLRSEEFPRGLQQLTETERTRVESGNKVAMACLRIAKMCTRLGVPFTLENPARSLIWWLPEYVKLMKVSHDVYFDMCMHGGRRKKPTRIMTNFPVFNKLHVCCNGAHEHLPWGKNSAHEFVTASEAAYPPLLCKRLAKLSMIA